MGRAYKDNEGLVRIDDGSVITDTVLMIADEGTRTIARFGRDGRPVTEHGKTANIEMQLRLHGNLRGYLQFEYKRK
jgi:hypothetical protein